MSFWDRPDAQEALATRHMDRLVLNEAYTAPPTCYQCGGIDKPGSPIGRHDWLCDECHLANERRYHDAYGDTDELTLRFMDGDR